MLASPTVSASTPFERFRATRFFPSIDGLRAISILAVILYHCDVPLPGVLGPQGFYGVSLFFVISGFLITTLLLREQDDTGAISLPNFYVRRTLRIFPLYYAVLAAFCVATFIFDRHSAEGEAFWEHLPWFVFYMNNWVIALGSARVIFAVSWSLATEEQFYLFWPSMVAFAPRRWMAAAAISGLMIGTWTMRVLIGRHIVDFGVIPNRMATSIAPEICMGCLLAFALHSRRSFEALYRVLSWRWSAVVALAAFLLLTALPVSSSAIHLVLVALLGAVVVRPDHVLRPFLESRTMRHIGVTSYGAYLLFTFVLNFGKRLVHLENPWARLLWTLPLTVGLATLVYRYYETPFLRLKRRFSGATRVGTASGEIVESRQPIRTPSSSL
jgi:peptidoglycan/LPS O-acetylase OafA/YrhL